MFCHWKLQLPLNSHSSFRFVRLSHFEAHSQSTIVYIYNIRCDGLVHRPIQTDCCQFQFMLGPRVDTLFDCFSAHMFILCTTSTLSLSLSRFSLRLSLCADTFTFCRCYSVVLTWLMHLHHNNSIFSVHLKIHSCYTDGDAESVQCTETISHSA